VVVVGLSALLALVGGNLLGLLIDALILFLLTRPSTRATASVSSATVKLSSRISSAPAASASSIWSIRSTSTSSGRSGKRSRMARTAAPTPPAATTWLSLISPASLRL
jgi:hypothetical protein